MNKKSLLAVLALASTVSLSNPALAETVNTGGLEAELTQYPWQVQVVSTMNGVEEAKVCGGAIISYQWAVTSAQCFFDTSNQLTVDDLDSVSITFFNPNSKQLVTATEVGVLVHENATGNPEDAYDIALLSVSDTSFPANSPIKLMSGLEEQSLSIEKGQYWIENQERLPLFVTSGFEGVEGGALKRDYLAGVPDANCEGYDERLTHCATTPHPEYVQGMCYGDIGSPLVWKNQENAGDSDYGLRLAGVATIGVDNCDNDNYSEYTIIADYVDWIDSAVYYYDGYTISQTASTSTYGYDPLADENMPVYTSEGELEVADNTDETDSTDGTDGTDATDNSENNESGQSSGGSSNDSSGGSVGLGLILALGATAYMRRKEEE